MTMDQLPASAAASASASAPASPLDPAPAPSPDPVEAPQIPAAPPGPHTSLPTFESLDVDDNFKKYQAYLEDARHLNFVVDYSKDAAEVTFDVDAAQFDALLKSKRPEARPTRWINIWAPNRQKALINSLGHRYRFSPRLYKIMQEQPPLPSKTPEPEGEAHLRDRIRRQVDRGMGRGSVDEEKVVDVVYNAPTKAGTPDLNHYRIVDEVWHYSSVDWGDKFLCIGYNGVHEAEDETRGSVQAGQEWRDDPKGTRLWTWLIICDDNTVISVHEDIFPDRGGEINEKQKKLLSSVRRNLMNVFRNVSLAPAASAELNALSTLYIRRGLQVLQTESDGTPSADYKFSEDAPCLLFHYLFDDWYTTYSLIAGEEQRYGVELFRLRKRMLERADLEDIKLLHHIGRQLAVLQRIYESYKLIIDRILRRQQQHQYSHLAAIDGEPSPTSSNAPNNLHSRLRAIHTHRRDHTSASINRSGRAVDHLGVCLTPAAIFRFERLRDRIELYAISEIHECIAEKESLVLMAFNLIAMKESQAVERLTRITILLAKVTILFLPVSLMTAYFSIQIEDNVFTLTSYWAAFAVVMGLSILGLLVFGYVSGTMEGQMVYRSLGQQFLVVSKAFVRGKRDKRRAQKSQ